jgi:hypothetical protein
MPRRISESLFCDFTTEEIEAKGQELSATMLAYDEVETAKKDATKEFTEQLKSLRGSIRGLSRAIKRKGEMGPVDCLVHFHVPTIGIKRIIRIDIGEIVREEPMTADERQENLFGEINELNQMWGDGPAPEANSDTETTE